MDKLFWTDPYMTSLTTRVRSVVGNDVTVEQTIFYAFSGGQESDRGTFNGIPVEEARVDGPEIIYTLPEGHGMECGTAVSMEIDWHRRYALMKLHFAAEIVLVLVTKHVPVARRVGAHIGEEKARLDFEFEMPITDHLPGLLGRAEDIISQDLPITSGFSNKKRQRRFWKIDGFATVPCGGTHLKSTGEIGHITLARKNTGKNKERVEIRLVN